MKRIFCSSHRVTSGTVLAAALMLCAATAQSGDAGSLQTRIDTHVKAVEAQLIAWRRYIHQHPEFGNHKTRTANLVADHLRKLGFEVKTGVAKTGMVGLLKGGKPGPVVA